MGKYYDIIKLREGLAPQSLFACQPRYKRCEECKYRADQGDDSGDKREFSDLLVIAIFFISHVCHLLSLSILYHDTVIMSIDFLRIFKNILRVSTDQCWPSLFERW